MDIIIYLLFVSLSINIGLIVGIMRIYGDLTLLEDKNFHLSNALHRARRIIKTLYDSRAKLDKQLK